MKFPKALTWEAVRFAFVGGAATGAHAVLYAILISAGFTPQLGNLAAFMCAFLISLLGHAYVTFPDKTRSRRLIDAARKLAVVAIAGFCLNALFVFIITGIIRTEPLYALIFMVFVTPALTFLALKFWAMQVVGAQ